MALAVPYRRQATAGGRPRSGDSSMVGERPWARAIFFPGLCLRATWVWPRHLQSIKDPCNKPLKLTPWRLLDRLVGLDYTERYRFAAARTLTTR